MYIVPEVYVFVEETIVANIIVERAAGDVDRGNIRRVALDGDVMKQLLWEIEKRSGVGSVHFAYVHQRVTRDWTHKFDEVVANVDKKEASQPHSKYNTIG